jgi:hypothetical protein
MTFKKSIHIPVSQAVVKQITALANEEGRQLEEMVQILLEDALALRETIKDQEQLT